MALTQLAEQDPLINLRQDDIRQELHVSLYGEVQKEVIGATLENEYDIDVEFRETTAICVERPVGIGEAFEIIPKDVADHSVPRHRRAAHRTGRGRLGRGVRARCRARVDPALVFKTVEAFQDAMERTVQETLRQGLYGWEVTDCTRHHDALRLLGPAEPRPRLRQELLEHRRRLPLPDPAGSDGRAQAGWHRGVRADAPLPPRDPG